jgi:hypothetical protein
MEAGAEEPGENCMRDRNLTWRQFVESFKSKESP